MAQLPQSDDTYEKVMNRAMGLLSARAYSCADLRAKLSKRCASAELVGEVIERLLELGYLNDVTFAANYARSRLRVKPLGRMQLARDLKRKQIASPIIDDTLDALFEEEDEQAHCRRALEKWVRVKGAPDSPRDRKRLTDHLARKGFGYGCIRAAMDAEGI